MNKIYRILWNDALQAWVAAPEIAKGKGKSSKSSKGAVLASPSSLPRFLLKALAIAILGITGQAFALGINTDKSDAICEAGEEAVTNNIYGEVACGFKAKATGIESVAIGARTNATGNTTIAIGNDVSATKHGSIIIGTNYVHGNEVSSDGMNSIAIGSAKEKGYYGADADGDYSVAIGGGDDKNKGATTKSAAAYGLAIGSGSVVNARGDMAIGAMASSDGTTSSTNTGDFTYANVKGATASAALAVGAGASAQGSNATAIGAGAQATSTGSVNTQQRADNVAIGAAANANYGGVAAGFKADASGNNAVAIGISAAAGAAHSVALGNASAASGSSSIAIGQNAKAGGNNNFSLGTSAGSAGVSKPTGYAGANDLNALTRGGYTSNIGLVNLTSIGNGAGKDTINNNYGVNIGYNAGRNYNSFYGEGVAIGRDAGSVTLTTTATNGGTVFVSGNTNVAISSVAGQNTAGHNNVAMGYHAGGWNTGSSNVAIGSQAGRLNYDTAKDAIDTKEDSSNLRKFANTIALGNKATVGANQAIALGLNSVANAEDATAMGKDAKALGVRTIAQGASATANASDALAIGTSATASAGTSTALGHQTIASGNSSIAIGNNGTKADGKRAIAIGRESVAKNVDSIAMGYKSNASGDNAIAIGNSSAASQQGAVALGWQANASKRSAVALGGESTTDTDATSEDSATVNGISYSGFAGKATEAGMQVSVGAAGKERQIKNVAAGKISSDSTDAINGSQLYATNNVLGNVANSITSNFGGNATLDPKTGSITFTDIGGTGQNTIHGAIGVNKTNIDTNTAAIAANKAAIDANKIHYYSVNNTGATQQHNYNNDGATGNYALAAGVNASATNLRTIAVGQATASGSRAIAMGSAVQNNGQWVYTEASGANSIAIGTGTRAKGVNSTALGNIAYALGNQSTALGRNSQALQNHSVAIGNNSVANAQVGDVAIGRASSTSTVTNVDSATVNNLTYSGFAGSNATSAFSVGGAAINYNGRSVTETRQIQNVAAGRITADSTDAINGSQLYATQNVIGNVAGSAVSVLGGNAAVGADGTISMTNIGGTGKNTIHDAIASLNNNTQVVGSTTITGDITDGSGNTATYADGSSASVSAAEALRTYDAEGTGTVETNSVLTAIKNINEQGTKYIHVNGGERSVGGTRGTNTEQSQANGAKSTAIGYQTVADGNHAVAMGNQAKAAGMSSIAIGDGAQATGANSISIGTGNQVSGNNSGAIGDPSIIEADGSYSVGNNNEVATGANDTFILGNHVKVNANVSNSVYLGSQSASDGVRTTAQNGGNYTYKGQNDTKVAGVGSDVVGIVSVGNATEKRQIQNVAAGIVSADSTDAINGSQLYYTNEAIAAIKSGASGIVQYSDPNNPTQPNGGTATNDVTLVGANTSAPVTIHNVGAGRAPTDAVNVSQLNGMANSINNHINDVDDHARTGIASAMASAGLPQAYLPGKSMVAAAVGHYRGENALAIGASTITDNGKWIIKGTANVNRKDAGVTVGLGYQW